VAGHVLLARELLENGLGKDLAELDTHLVIRVDAPDGTLDVDLVLVQCNQSTEGTGSEFLEEDRVGGLVALEDLGLDKCGVRRLGTKLLDNLLLSLAKGERPEMSVDVHTNV
jgi:hypothetical protein